MKIIIKEKFDNELMEKWEELEKDSVITFFQTYYCNNSWFKNIEHKNNFKLQIVICEYHSKLFAIFPFILKKKFTLTTLEWAGQNLFDYFETGQGQLQEELLIFSSYQYYIP